MENFEDNIEENIYKNSTLRDEINLQEVFFFSLRNKFLILSILFLSTMFGITYALTRKEIWQGEFQIVLNLESDKSSIGSGIQPNSPFGNLLSQRIGGKNRLKTEVGVLRSPSVLMPVFESLKSRKKDLGYKVENWNFSGWRNNYLKIDLEKSTTILDIKYKDKDKELIIPVLDDISRKYQDYSTEDKKKSIEKGLVFLDEQIKLYKLLSIKSMNEFEKFKIENDLQDYVLNPSENGNLDISNVNENLSKKITIIEAQIENLKKNDNYLSKRYLSKLIYNDNFKNDSNISTSITEVEKKLSRAKTLYRDESLEVKSLERKRAFLIKKHE